MAAEGVQYSDAVAWLLRGPVHIQCAMTYDMFVRIPDRSLRSAYNNALDEVALYNISDGAADTFRTTGDLLLPWMRKSDFRGALCPEQNSARCEASTFDAVGALFRLMIPVAAAVREMARAAGYTLGCAHAACCAGEGVVPPPLPPNLFACPDRQQVVPGVRPPEARSDLVDLMRVVNDHIAAAMGVPASVIFEGKFSSNSMSQLQLLNSTIQSIAISVNKVLTATYHAVYDDAKEGDELTLLTAPLCSTTELQALFEAGVIDIESALPAALHSLGCTAVEIAGAVKRRKLADQAGTDTKLLEAQNAAKVGDADVALKGAQTLKTAAETEVVKQQVGKTKAETKKLMHDASAPHPTPGAASSSGSSGSGGSSGGSKAKK